MMLKIDKKGSYKMEKKLECLRKKLYLAIDKGNTDEIIKASQECDVEIVKILRKNLNIEVKNEK